MILANTKFDFVRISHLKAKASRLSRVGSAEFRVIAAGSTEISAIAHNFGTTSSDWSMGFEEAGPGVWKVNRISPTRMPGGMPGPGGSGRSRYRGERRLQEW
jgi:hypothetical protein